MLNHKTEQAIDLLVLIAVAITGKWQLACWRADHVWADEERYGVEPECLTCGKRREDISDD